MKEPNINLIRRNLNLSNEDKFIGYFIFNPLRDDFLSSYKGDSDMAFFEWTKKPEYGICFKLYKKAFKIIKRFELNRKAIILMGFEFGSQLGFVEVSEELIN